MSTAVSIPPNHICTTHEHTHRHVLISRSVFIVSREPKESTAAKRRHKTFAIIIVIFILPLVFLLLCVAAVLVGTSSTARILTKVLSLEPHYQTLSAWTGYGD